MKCLNTRTLFYTYFLIDHHFLTVNKDQNQILNLNCLTSWVKFDHPSKAMLYFDSYNNFSNNNNNNSNFISFIIVTLAVFLKVSVRNPSLNSPFCDIEPNRRDSSSIASGLILKAKKNK